jgi:membrane protein implicated in regulation of membrane protease activity
VEDWVIWMIAAGVLAVGEIFSLSFFLGPIAVAAAVAAVAALVGAGLAIQIVVFILASGASIGLLRPVARRHLRTPAQLRTGTAALVGETAVVLERVDRDGGQVKLAGEVWTARAFDEDEVLEPGARVQVMQIQGATALVSD